MQKQYLDIPKEELSTILPAKCLNINIGVLGHVDSGKTSICRLLSAVTSTASLDKNPQSQERGITLDLGFSAFFTRVPARFEAAIKEQYLQFTLVDCPGHASLIRTIIGGSQIIDMMFLILDVTKGIQAQTAECIIIAELLMKKMVVVLNKVDMLEEGTLAKRQQTLRKVFAKTKFGQNVQMIPCSTKVDDAAFCRKLKESLLASMELPDRKIEGRFLYLIDHCFKIKGKGTVITGTVLQGRIKPNQQIQLPQLQQKCKIKSMQMFRKPVQQARQGDRIAMLMQHLQAQTIERGIACLPGYLKKMTKIVVDLNVVRLYKRPIKSKGKLNIMSGHQTVQGQLRLLYSQDGKFDGNQPYLAISQIEPIHITNPTKIFAIITLESAFYSSLNFTIIGYKPDIDNDQKACRIAFHGIIHASLDPEQHIKLYKDKEKKGFVDRVVDAYSLIVKDMFQKGTNIAQFVGKQVIIAEKKGKIQGAFGNSGKYKVIMQNEIQGIGEGDQVKMKYTKWYQ